MCSVVLDELCHTSSIILPWFDCDISTADWRHLYLPHMYIGLPGPQKLGSRPFRLRSKCISYTFDFSWPGGWCVLMPGSIGDFCIGDASRCLAISSINTSRLFAEGSVIPPEHRLMLVNFHRECIGDAKKSPVGPSHYARAYRFLPI